MYQRYGCLAKQRYIVITPLVRAGAQSSLLECRPSGAHVDSTHPLVLLAVAGWTACGQIKHQLL